MKTFIEKLTDVKNRYADSVKAIEKAKAQQLRLCEIITEHTDDETKKFLSFDDFKLRTDENIDEMTSQVEFLHSSIKFLDEMIEACKNNETLISYSEQLLKALNIKL